MDRITLPESQSTWVCTIRWFVGFVLTPGRLEQFLRYVVVSGVSLGLDLAVFTALVWMTALPSALAGALSTTAGLFVHYFMATRVVFDKSSTGKNDSHLIVIYMLTGILGFAITAVAMFVSVDLAGLPVFAGKGIAVAATFVTVYLVRAGIVFAPAGAPASDTRGAAA